MNLPLRELDQNQLFICASNLWTVIEVVTDSSDIIQHLKCRRISELRRGTTTIPSAFAIESPIVSLQPDMIVTVLSKHMFYEMTRC